MSDTYLITGGAGNIACQLTFELVRQGHQIVLFDVADRPSGRVADGCRYVQGDITDRDQIRRLICECRPGAVLHFSSLLSAACEQDRDRAWRVNMDGAFGLFEEVLAHQVGTLFFLSSIASYGAPAPSPLPEDQPQWPMSLYGATKAGVERLGYYYYARHGLDFRSIRPPIVISSLAHAGAASAYASRAYIDAVKEGQFTFRVRPESQPAMVYIKDLLAAIIGLISVPSDRLSRRVYNIHGLAPTSVQLADAIRQRVTEAELVFDPVPEVADLVDSWPAVIDDQSARADWGWSPQYDLERMSDDFVEELRRAPENASGLRRVD